MKKVMSFWKVGVLAGIMGGMVSAGLGADGRWVGPNSINWGNTTAAWFGNIIPDGIGGTATFDRNDVNGARVVVVDSERTIGNLLVTDTRASIPATGGNRNFTIDARTNALVMNAGIGKNSIISNAGHASFTICGTIKLVSDTTIFENLTGNIGYITTNGIQSEGLGMKQVIARATADRINFHGIMSGNVALTVEGLGNYVNIGATNVFYDNTYVGGTSIMDGARLRIYGNQSLGVGSVTFGGAGASLTVQQVDAAGKNIIINDMILNSAGNVIAVGANSVVFSGNISGSQGITFNATGAGSIILTGQNNYAGITTLARGNLVVMNQALASSGYTVGAQGTLDVSAVTYDLTGKTIEIAATGGNVTTANVGKMVFGDVTLGGDLELKLDLTESLLGDFNFFEVTGTVSGNFNSVALSGALSLGLGWDAGLSLWTGTDGTNTYTFDIATGGLSVVPVPEASTYGVIAGLAVLAGVLMRRRRG